MFSLCHINCKANAKFNVRLNTGVPSTITQLRAQDKINSRLMFGKITALMQIYSFDLIETSPNSQESVVLGSNNRKKQLCVSKSEKRGGGEKNSCGCEFSLLLPPVVNGAKFAILAVGGSTCHVFN